MNHLIIIEGPDNTGKTTLVSLLTKKYRRLNDIILMHSIGPNKNILDPSESLKFQKNIFLNQAYKIAKIVESDNDNIIIMDRAWYGEYVYGQIYRKESANLIIDMLNEVDSFLSNYNIKRSTFLMNGNPDFILKNDDLKSFFSDFEQNKKRELVQQELNLFKECFNKITLSKDNLCILDIEKNMKFVGKKSILNTAINFIER